MNFQFVLLFCGVSLYVEAVNPSQELKPEIRVTRQSSSSSSSASSSSSSGNGNGFSVSGSAAGIGARVGSSSGGFQRNNNGGAYGVPSGGYGGTGGGGGYGGTGGYGNGNGNDNDDNNYDYGDDQRYNSGYNNNGFPPPVFQFPQLPFNQPIIPPIVFPSFPSGNQNSDFGRIGGSSGNGYNGNRGGGSVSSFSGIQSGPDGRVTTIQGGSGQPNIIQTRLGAPGKVNGVYSSSGFNVGPDGKVTSYKDSGHF